MLTSKLNPAVLSEHPFLIKSLRIWNVQYTSQSSVPRLNSRQLFWLPPATPPPCAGSGSNPAPTLSLWPCYSWPRCHWMCKCQVSHNASTLKRCEARKRWHWAWRDACWLGKGWSIEESDWLAQHLPALREESNRRRGHLDQWNWDGWKGSRWRKHLYLCCSRCDPSPDGKPSYRPSNYV